MSADNKKEKDVSKVDFDFSGISGERRQKAQEEVKTPKGEILTGASETKRGVVLSVPLEGGGWVAKDIADVTPEEFLAWAARVYPAEINVSREKLLKLNNRMMIFNKIVRYHVDSPFQQGRMEPGKKREILPN